MRRHLEPLSGAARDYDSLLQLIGPARFALLGEASHGTADFYRERIRITQRLIAEQGFTAVAVEADWPDAWRVNRYVRGLSDDRDAVAALSGFQRFPAWMWRNTEVRDFVEWLRDYNSGRGQGEPGRLLRHRPVQPVQPRCRPCWPTSTGPTRKPPAGPARATPASTTPAKTARPTATAPATA